MIVIAGLSSTTNLILKCCNGEIRFESRMIRNIPMVHSESNPNASMVQLIRGFQYSLFRTTLVWYE
jgi:hypothetical protein